MHAQDESVNRAESFMAGEINGSDGRYWVSIKLPPFATPEGRIGSIAAVGFGAPIGSIG
jgi:hypothetical protein